MSKIKCVLIFSFLRCANIYGPENIRSEHKKGAQMKGIKVDEKYTKILLFITLNT